MPPKTIFPSPPRGCWDDFDKSWSYLATSMDLIMAGLEDGLSYRDYLNPYSAVYNLYTSGRFVRARRGGGVPGGSRMYDELESYFISHLQPMITQSESLRDVQLLKYYVDEWDRYTTGVAYLNSIFAYHYRHWVKRERDEGRRDVHETYIHALLKWKCHFLERIQQDDAKLTKALLLLLHQQRDGELINQGLIKKTIDSFVSLGLDETNPATRCLDVYRDQFENSFLQATSDYYRTEAERLLVRCCPSDHLKHVEDRLRGEEVRVMVYLPQEAQSEVTKCEGILLRAHSLFVLQDFRLILEGGKFDDIKRMYTLLGPEGLELLLARFEGSIEGSIERAGVNAVSVVSGRYGGESGVVGAHSDAVLTVRNKSLEVVSRCFSGDAQFATRLDDILNEVVSRSTLSPFLPLHL